jgi:hypothetical protein
LTEPPAKGSAAPRRITLVNLSQSVASSLFDGAVAALQKQVDLDFQPAWQVSATLAGTTRKLEEPVRIEGVHDALIYLGDASLDPTTGVQNVLGYHSDTYRGVPYGFVYLDVCAQYAESWTTTLSHEVLELLADPAASQSVSGPAPQASGQAVQYYLEVCDPTQKDSYSIDGVSVSNFVFPAYFGRSTGPAGTNHLQLPLQPFGVRPGGYCMFEDGGGVHQVTGEAAPQLVAAREAGRKRMGPGRRNTRRARRFPAA